MVSRTVRSLGSRVAAWVVESLSRSGEGQAVMWQSFAQEHPPPSILRMSRRDRADLQMMKNDPQFGSGDV